ncbi:MAG: endo alpha-1,4 polygalactosaminidase, partial [Candidatus Omnitrophota bacterium]
MKKKLFLSLSVIWLALGILISWNSFPVYASTISIDGDIADWAGITALATDADDMPDDNLDAKAGYATNDADYLYLRFDVYGNIVRSGSLYFIYLDTDQDSSTGFTYGWWTTGADYRIYIDEWTIGLQKFMGTNQSDDIWGWDGIVYDLKNIPVVYQDSVIECAVLRADIEEVAGLESTNILWRAWPGDDAIPYYSDLPVVYDYGYAYSEEDALVVDDFEYSTSTELNTVYNTQCDAGAFLSATSDSIYSYQGNYCAKLDYSLNGLWSMAKLVRNLPLAEDWSNYKNISLWVKGYSGCTENLLVYIIESDGDEWFYQNNTVLVNESWTKVIIPLAGLEDNLWDGGLGDGDKTLTEVVGYKIVIHDIIDDGATPVNKSIYIDNFLKDDGLLSLPHSIPDVNNYVCYYAGGRTEDLATFDLVIIPSDLYTPEEIAQIKDSGTVVIGYVSLGEDVRELQTGDATGPISSGILAYKGYASYYLDDNPKDGLPDQNSIWGGYFINAGNAIWQNYIINTIIDEIINVKNCDGVFLDTIGIVESPYYSWSSPGMISMIAAIRKAYPNKYLIANNRGFSIMYDFEKYVNALMFESFTSTYDFISQSYKKWEQEQLDYTTLLANEINTIRGYPAETTLNVFSLDYCRIDDYSLYNEDYLRAESFGFIPCVSDIYLSKIYALDTEPSITINPVSNFNAALIISRRKNRVNLTWDVNTEYIESSNVSHYVIKRTTVTSNPDWETAAVLESNLSPYATAFVDKNPPSSGEARYAIETISAEDMSLIGRLETSCFIQ